MVSLDVVQNGQIWRVATGAAVHSDLRHLVSNAILFGLFAYLLFGYFGFWMFPVLVVLLGCLTNYLALLTYPPSTQLLGASGVVYVMAGLWLSIYVLVERRLAIGKRLLRAIGLGLIVLLPATFQPQVSYRTHAIGLLIGLFSGVLVFFVVRETIRQAEVREYEHEEGSEPTFTARY